MNLFSTGYTQHMEKAWKVTIIKITILYHIEIKLKGKMHPKIKLL